MTKPTNPLLIKFRNNRLLIFALIVSLLAHLTLLSNFSIHMPQAELKKSTLSVSLINSQLSAASVTLNSNTNTVDTTHTTEIIPHKIPVKSIKKQKVAQPSETLELLKTSQPKSIENETIDHITVPAATALEDPQVVLVSTTEAKQEAGTTEKPSPPTYRYVEVEYEVSKDNIVSQSRETFNIDKNGSYLLTALVTYKDIAGHVVRSDKQRSEGTISELGLIPGYYFAEEGTDVSKKRSVSFAWQEGVINLQYNNQNKIEPLVQGLQDLLSYKYQLMFRSNAKTINLTIADGIQLNTYTYQLIGEEILLTKLGELKTLHLQSNDYDAKNDIWLALDYQYLPIKISHTNAVGVMTEQQLVSAIGTVNQ